MTRSTILVIALMMSTAPVLAQPKLSAADKQAVQQHCSTDFKKYCKAFISGDASLKAGITSCIKQKHSSFSKSCKRSLVTAKLHSM